MDFFEAQARAKKRTHRLVALFAVAVVGTIIAGYFMAIFAVGQAPGRVQRHRGYIEYQPDDEREISLWQPPVFAVVSLGTLLIVGGASLYKWSEFRTGGAAVAESVGGRRVDAHTIDLNERRLLNVIEEMAIASGVPMPAVYVLDDEPAINAFAAGLTTSDAVVTVTRGAMEKLTRDELQGVIGHEFSHILNGDMRLNVKLSAILFGILVIGLIGRGILGSLRYSRPRGRNAGGVIAGIFVVGVALLILGYVGYFFGRIIQAAVSRQREFLADASSVQFTRNPGGLTGALKKIGGYALGSSLQTTKATAIGHFFFAQGFISNFGGAWATHPPLDERIRAIDPQFDGKFFEPKTVVDVAHEPWSRPGQPGNVAGFAPGALEHTAMTQAAAQPAPRSIPFQPASIIATAGAITSGQVEHAQQLLAALPEPLRTAARAPATATALVYGLLLATDPVLRAKQQALVVKNDSANAALILSTLLPALGQLQEQARLPLLQLTLPALRSLDAAARDRFVTTLDELVYADGQVSVFEFSLQKVLIHHLQLGQKPVPPGDQIYSFNAVATEIAVVLSALARVSADNEAGSTQAFAAGAAQLRMLEGQLTLLAPAACDFKWLDAALTKLSTASGPIKQRLLTAAAHIVDADGVVLVAEAELLRAIAATLDVPLPPLASAT
jgi:Zn-dependent protease with chaperone function/uncharacterized tellurite resistance protein B-like protein